MLNLRPESLRLGLEREVVEVVVRNRRSREQLDFGTRRPKV